MSIRRAHIEAGLTRPRQKRAFGEIDQGEEPMEAAVPEEDNSDFTDLARRLIRDSEASDEGIDNEGTNDLVPVIHLPARSQPNTSNNNGAQPRLPSQRITLASLFNYTSDSAGLDFYWKGGLKNLEQELAAYDLLFEEEDEEDESPEMMS